MQETQETHVHSLGQEGPLEEVMATHSSILVWTIPWMEEPGGLQSMGLQRVGHNWTAEHACKTSLLCEWIPRVLGYPPLFLSSSGVDCGGTMLFPSCIKTSGILEHPRRGPHHCSDFPTPLSSPPHALFGGSSVQTWCVGCVQWCDLRAAGNPQPWVPSLGSDRWELKCEAGLWIPAPCECIPTLLRQCTP